MRPVLVTGARGLVGSAICELLRTAGRPVVAWTRAEANLSDPGSLRELLLRVQPGLVLHCAAWTDVDQAEIQPAECQVINVDASAQLAASAREIGAAFVYISSGGIFEGSKSAPYDETDRPAPRTVYHRSKYEGELAVAARHPGALVVRLSWMYGGGRDQKKNFVAARIREASGKPVLSSSMLQRGSPTWSRDAAAAIIKLSSAGASGVCHVANSGMASRFDYVSAIVATAGLSTKVAPAQPGAFLRKADVPANEALTSVRLDEWGVAPLPPWREALSAYLSAGLPA